VFVFPSKTDTLGLVNLEAMACGKSVVAYDIDTMRGIIQDGENGILVAEDEPLESAIPHALTLSSTASLQKAQDFSWDAYRHNFLRYQAPIPQSLWTSLSTSIAYLQTGGYFLMFGLMVIE